MHFGGDKLAFGFQLRFHVLGQGLELLAGLAQLGLCPVPVVHVLQRAHQAKTGFRPVVLHHLADPAHPAVAAVAAHAARLQFEVVGVLGLRTMAAPQHRRPVLRVHQGREPAQESLPVFRPVAQHFQAVVGEVALAFRQADVEDADARSLQGQPQGLQLGGGQLGGLFGGLFGGPLARFSRAGPTGSGKGGGKGGGRGSGRGRRRPRVGSGGAQQCHEHP